jgi:hypothetical protein
MPLPDKTLPNVYVLYNAKASVFGKLDYVCRKLISSAESPACSACDLTHGGLHLTETKAWSKSKGQIGANVYQLHRDELTPEVGAEHRIIGYVRKVLMLAADTNFR